MYAHDGLRQRVLHADAQSKANRMGSTQLATAERHVHGWCTRHPFVRLVGNEPAHASNDSFEQQVLKSLFQAAMAMHAFFRIAQRHWRTRMRRATTSGLCSRSAASTQLRCLETGLACTGRWRTADGERVTDQSQLFQPWLVALGRHRTEVAHFVPGLPPTISAVAIKYVRVTETREASL